MLSFDTANQHFCVNGAPIALTPSEIEEMNSIRWWHQIPFAPGLKSNGFSNAVNHIPDYLLDEINFKGKSVADIGCWDGFQLFYAEALGATRVVGIDDLSQRHSGDTARDFAKRKLKSRIEFLDANVFDLTPATHGTYDVVTMFGVIYHLIHPMLGIERMCSIAKEEILISTHAIDAGTEIPLCVLYPDGELEGDETNWAGPNIPWLRKALAIQGFEVRKENVYNGDRITIHAKRVENKYTQNPKLNQHRDTTIIDAFRENRLDEV